MNIFVCTGNLARDVEVRYTQSGTAVAGFSIGVKSGYGDKATTLWLKCSLWGKRAEGGLIDYLKKGQQVAASGELGMDEWTAKDGTQGKAMTLKISELDLIGSKPSASQARAPEKAAEPPAADAFEDDIPF